MTREYGSLLEFSNQLFPDHCWGVEPILGAVVIQLEFVVTWCYHHVPILVTYCSFLY
jgi:hypothetical protein